MLPGNMLRNLGQSEKKAAAAAAAPTHTFRAFALLTGRLLHSDERL